MRKLFLLFLLMAGINKVMLAQLTWNFGTTAISGAVTNLPANITSAALTTTSQGLNFGTTLFLGTPAVAPFSTGAYAGASGSFTGNSNVKIGSYFAPTTTVPSTNSYVQFVLTPVANNWVNFTGISWGNLSYATGPTSFYVFTSLDNFLNPVAKAIGTPGTTPIWTLANGVDIVNGGTFAPINGAVGTALTIRILAYGGVGPQPVTGSVNWRVDDIKITATAQTSTTTVGWIPKYTGPTTFTNSIITENNGNIGIGTTALAQKLDIAGGIKFTGALLAGATPTAGLAGQVLKSTGPTTAPEWGAASAGAETDPVVKAINGIVKSNGTTISAAIAGTDYLTPTGSITQSQVTNLGTDLAAKQGLLSLTNNGTGAATLVGNTLNIPNYTSGITNSAWGLQGNAGTNPATNFIGTIDAKDLLIKTNGQQVAKFSGDNSWKISLGILDNQATGTYSLATGEASIASGQGSFSANFHTNAEGFYSSSFGYQSKAQGFASVALGSSTAIGQNSLSSGIGYAYGKSSVALGDRPLAKSFSEIAVGMNSTNYTAGSTTAYYSTDRLFVVGNGVDYLNPSDALVILKNGNTGLGTSNPTKNLHIYGQNPSVFIEGDAVSYYPELRIKSQVGEGYIDNYGPGNYAYGMFLNTLSLQNKHIGVGASKTGGVAFTDDPSLVSFRVVSTANQTNDIFKVIQNTATTPGFFTESNALVVNKDGKVLVGNTTGLNLGDHLLAVNGSAIFTKAVVRLTNTWPDYVFEPTNKLPTLAEIEAYIKKHKHLEGVPSAEEVKEKGIDLGDNQTILLKKVEELTLYMIELNKKIEALAKENEELKKKVNGDK